MARIKRKHEKIRMNLDMSIEIKQKLEDLRDVTDADSMSEVIRRSIALYSLLCKEKENGGATILKAKDGTEKQLEFL